MAILETANAETEDLSQFDATHILGGTLTAVAEAKKNGSFGYKALFDGLESFSRAGGVLEFTARDEAYTSIWLYIDSSMGGASNAQFDACNLYAGGVLATLCRVNFNGSGVPYRFVMNYVGAGFSFNESEFALDTWMHIEVRCKKGTGSDSEHDIWVNDVNILSATDGALTTQLDTIFSGVANVYIADVDADSIVYFDDVLVSDDRQSGAADIDIALDVGAMTYTGFAPTVAVDKDVPIDLGVLSYTGFALAVAVTLNTFIALDVGAMTYTGFEPTAVVTNHIDVDVDVGALTYTGFALTVNIGNNIPLDVGGLDLTGFALSVAVSDHQDINLDLGVLTYTGFEPTVATPTNIDIGLGVLTYTGFAPAVAISNNQDIDIDVGALTYTGFALTAVTTANQDIGIGLGALTYTGLAPTVVVAGGDIDVDIGLGVLTYTGFAPEAFTIQGFGIATVVISEVVTSTIITEVEPTVVITEVRTTVIITEI